MTGTKKEAPQREQKITTSLNDDSMKKIDTLTENLSNLVKLLQEWLQEETPVPNVPSQANSDKF